VSIPSLATAPGQSVRGGGSWFGGPNDHSDSGHTASGGTTKEPGIAVYNRATLGGYWRVTGPNGRTAVIRQTDLGPAPWTNRKIDVTYSALGKLGYNEGNFPTNATFSATYLGNNPGSQQQQPQRQPSASIPGLPGGKVSIPASTNKGLLNLASMWSGDPLLKSVIESKAQSPAQSFGTPGTPGMKGPALGAAPSSGKLGGFLPAGAELQIERIDQGQDIKTNPGGPIIAPGDGEVVSVKSDPSGFGPNYPVVKFTTGKLAGTTWYIGHTHSDLKAGEHFRAGQALSATGKGPGPVGNATVPGWAEIGLASALGTGNMSAGNATKRYLR
jgi:hypothetical protein